MQIRQENVALAVSPFYIFHETKLQEGERTRIKELNSFPVQVLCIAKSPLFPELNPSLLMVLVWNKLAADLRSVLTLSTVKNKLKSFLFSQDCI